MMRKFPFLHLILFILTLFSTLAAGAVYAGVNLLKEPLYIYKGSPFAGTLMAILLSHELSHYFTSKRYKVKATLPYFIPAPTIFGTFGAIIKMKSPIITRKALIDIGASGPIAGFILSVIATSVGLSLSKITITPQTEGALIFGDSILYSFLSRIILGEMHQGQIIIAHPVAIAGWIGLFVTFINLIPVGQLDGGHIAYAILGERHIHMSNILVVIMVFLGLFIWEGWAVWAVLLLILGLRHPPVVYWEASLDPKRRFVGWVSFFIFVITFIPVPLQVL